MSILENKFSSFAILIVTCDNYSDLWRPFHFLFQKHWPGCALKTYIMTNELKPALPPFVPLSIGRDISWSDNLIKALDEIPEKYVLMFLEDLMLVGPVDTHRLEAILEWAEQNNPHHVRLNCGEKPTGRVTELLGHIAPGAIYRTSTVLSLWRKDTLKAVLAPGESAWQFELIGSQRSDAFDGFYAAYHSCFPVLNSVIKGKLLPSAVKKLQSQGVCFDLTRRATMTPVTAARFSLVMLRHKLSRLVPWRYRRQMRAWFFSSSEQ